ncbi:MAG TPA: pyruvate dehydrogenase complex dihydrolipoamide acetyltransferase [Stellaceae bacterium]|jgi:pyruvate dehydrogenase E2 component (dihydrolipoamide acetyltransferase)|nr:pyruvate dehydrogenase complex dihydrolipoamide acetyltransferase [Stellaceae bacterium]
MPIEILMPALSPTMTEGNVTKWLKREGEEVHSGDVLAEIETDKATMEFEAVDDGRLGKILVPEGAQGIKVNQPIALLLGEGEDTAALENFSAPSPKTAPTAPPEQAPAHAQPGPEAQAQTAPTRGNGRIFASPLARRMAQQAGLDLAAITGSGPQGRVVKADIEAALSAERAAPVPTPARPAAQPQPAPLAAPALSKERVLALAGNPPHTERPLTAMRRVIARRLTESKQTVPHFYLTIDCEIDELLKFRAELNAKSDAYRISVNDFVIRAAALALRQVPAANASWSDEAILLWDAVDVAVAVALEDGLITPIVKNADRKGLATIANETKDLAARARTGKLKLEEFQGGTFSISNLGMFGVRDFAAVINPPHGGILAVGAGEQRPIVKDGALAIATVMSCTLSCDHRAVDGAVGAQFLAAFKKLVEDPLTMLL